MSKNDDLLKKNLESALAALRGWSPMTADLIERQLKRLQQENEELKEEDVKSLLKISRLMETIGDKQKEINKLQSQLKTAVEENEELKKENTHLKKRKQDWDRQDWLFCGKPKWIDKLVRVKRLDSQLKTAAKALENCHEFFAKVPFHETEYLHQVTREIVDELYDQTEQALKEIDEKKVRSVREIHKVLSRPVER